MPLRQVQRDFAELVPLAYLNVRWIGVHARHGSGDVGDADLLDAPRSEKLCRPQRQLALARALQSNPNRRSLRVLAPAPWRPRLEPFLRRNRRAAAAPVPAQGASIPCLWPSCDASVGRSSICACRACNIRTVPRAIGRDCTNEGRPMSRTRSREVGHSGATIARCLATLQRN